jgi:excisionase family DNA binding protein
VETYLTIEGLAEYLKLAEQTIRRWVLNREIPFRKIKKVIRFRVSEIEKWVDDGGILKASSNAVCVENETDEGGLFGEELETVDGAEDKPETVTAKIGG